MKRSTERILTTHTGSLPRPDDLADMLFAKESGELGDRAAFDARVRSAYGAENFARLADAKRNYDPANVFRFNQNIRVAEQPQGAQLS